MKKHLALTAAIGLALTLLACEDKEKKQTPAETQTAETEAATETQQPTQAADTKPPETASEIPLAKAEEVVKSTFTDPRDSKTYKTVKIGNQTWMAENLNFEAEGSVCYKNDPTNCQKYGRLYDWNTAIKACPKGWHLPSNVEWGILTKVVGGYETAGKYLKATSGWNDAFECVKYIEDNCDEYGEKKSGNGTDNYGFSALPGGGPFSSIGFGGEWWSATESRVNYAYGWGTTFDEESFSWLDYDKSKFYHSVRCIKD
jgi:Fibrobacter succinogenes major domain (Fib_succ_major).